MVSGERYRSDVIAVKGNDIFVLELSIGLEANLCKNAKRKKEKYMHLLTELSKDWKVHYVNLSFGG